MPQEVTVGLRLVEVLFPCTSISGAVVPVPRMEKS